MTVFGTARAWIVGWLIGVAAGNGSGSAGLPTDSAGVARFHHENVLGTSMELKVLRPNRRPRGRSPLCLRRSIARRAGPAPTASGQRSQPMAENFGSSRGTFIGALRSPGIVRRMEDSNRRRLECHGRRGVRLVATCGPTAGADGRGVGQGCGGGMAQTPWRLVNPKGARLLTELDADPAELTGRRATSSSGRLKRF